jgi:hypothetical protein
LHCITDTVVRSICTFRDRGVIIIWASVTKGEISDTKKLFSFGHNRSGGVGQARIPAEGVFQKIVYAVAVRISLKIGNCVGSHPGGEAR